MADAAKPKGLQAVLDAADDGDALTIRAPLEREGPFVLRRGVTLDGGGTAAVWSRASPVVTIHAPRAALHNLRVEYTGDDPDACALHLLADGVELKNVVVRGNILGVRGESGLWRYPHQLYLGKLAPDRDVTFRLRLATPVACRLTSEIDGLTIAPAALPPGLHEVRLQVEGLRRDTLLFGVIAIETPGVRREVVVNGHAVPPGGPDVPMFPADHVVWQPDDWEVLRKPPVKAVPERPAAAPEPTATVLPPKSSRLRTGVANLGSLFTQSVPPPAEAKAAAADPPVAPPPAPVVEVRKRRSVGISPLFGGTPPPDEAAPN